VILVVLRRLTRPFTRSFKGWRERKKERKKERQNTQNKQKAIGATAITIGAILITSGAIAIAFRGAVGEGVLLPLQTWAVACWA